MSNTITQEELLACPEREKIERFKADGADDNILTLDQEYTRRQRAIIHEFCKTNGLYSHSFTREGTTIKYIEITKVPCLHEEEMDARMIDFFAKYSMLSIPVPDSNSFKYYLNTMNRDFDANKLFERFMTDVEQFGGFEAYFSHVNNVSEKVKKTIREHTEYKKFQETKHKAPETETRRALYNHTQNEKRFISFDIRSANYTVIKELHPTLFPQSTWAEYLKQFTDSAFLLSSKYFREIIFGDLKVCADVTKLSTRIMAELATDLEERFSDFLKSDRVAYKHGDELVYEIDPDAPGYENTISSIRSYIYTLHGIGRFHIDVYTLRQLGSCKYFVKEYDDGRIEYKCVPKKALMQCIKEYHKLILTTRDLEYVDDHHVVAYKYPIFGKREVQSIQ